MNNFISDNINFLTKKGNLSLDEFGNIFDLSKGLTGQYVRKLSLPKIVTIQKICAYYNLSIDDFVNTDLSILKSETYNQVSQEYIVNQAAPGYGYVSLKYVELLEKSIEDKDKIIKSLEDKLERYDKSKTA